ncbi:MAG TPA: iron-containing alcohol dehydrogenase [Thermoleophilia bacterium]|nr:iron-containing alcohol dehydrogenase [Thermoleophilia bacterium]
MRDHGWMGLEKVFRFVLPTRLQIGPGVASHVGEQVRAFGRRALLVSDPGVVEAGVLEPLRQDLARAGVECAVFSDVEPNPRVATVDRAVDAAAEHRADVLVAVGGGSVLDTAKAASAVITHGGSVFDYEGEDRVPGPVIPLVALPTTSGTGSEVTSWAIITDTTRHYKMALGSAFLAPRIAWVDPLLTTSLPPSATAGTGMDALTHAIEAFTARCSNPITDGLALYAIELTGAMLERAVGDGADVEARCGMSMASVIAGIAFGNADTAAVHSMAEALGGLLDVPHGLANAICLPYVMRFNLPAVPEKTARIGEALGLDTSSRPVNEAAMATVEAIIDLRARLGIPSMRSLGVTEDHIPRLASIALLNLGNPDNPVDVNERVFTDLFREALAQPDDVSAQTVHRSRDGGGG